MTGTVSYGERATLPSTAELRVTLYEIAGPTAQPSFIAEQIIPNPGQPPLRFRVTYPPNVIEPKARYTLVARIEIRGKLAFESERPVPVLTLGHPARVEMLVTQVVERVPGF